MNDCKTAKRILELMLKRERLKKEVLEHEDEELQQVLNGPQWPPMAPLLGQGVPLDLLGRSFSPPLTGREGIPPCHAVCHTMLCRAPPHRAVVLWGACCPLPASADR